MGNFCPKTSSERLAVQREQRVNTYSDVLGAKDEQEEQGSNRHRGNASTPDTHKEEFVNPYHLKSSRRDYSGEEFVTPYNVTSVNTDDNVHEYDYITDPTVLYYRDDGQYEEPVHLQLIKEQDQPNKSTAVSEKKGELPVGQPYVTDSIDSNSIGLKWCSPRPLTGDEAFNISYKEDNGRWKAYDQSSKDEMLTIRGLKPKTKYYFRVKIINDNTGKEGPFSAVSNAVQTGESPALRILQKSSLGQKSIPPIYTLPIEEDKQARNSKAKTRKFILGDSRRTKNKEEKTIMVVGATGSGKSTLINAIANYVVGVSWDDPFRFTLVNLEQSEQQKRGDQAQSQTEWVTCYTIYQSECSRLDYTINLIDTPGFGDTRGLDHDKNIVHQIRELFSSRGRAGVDTIDAVCFIVKAPDSRLTITQKYIFDSILSLFGNDIKENICTLITFADGERPPVLAGIQALEGVPLPYEQYFTFNNSALFVKNVGNPQGSLSPMFWKMGIQSCENFFRHVQSLQTRSLTLTTEVLNKRHTLQNKIHNLQIEVDKGLGKISTLEDEIVIFTNFKDAIKDNADFEYEVEEQEQKNIDLQGTGQHTTTCLTCHSTCHEKCMIADDRKKDGCIAMVDGKCTECPGLCAWHCHFNTPYVIKLVTVKKKKRYAEKLRKYQEATQQKLSREQLIDEMKQDIDELDNSIQAILEITARLNNRLKEIALRPDPMSTVDYIDLMIDAEMKEKQSGFKHRIDALKRCRESATVGHKVKIFHDRLAKSTETISMDHLDKASKDDGILSNIMKNFKLLRK